MLTHGTPWVLCIDLDHSPFENVLDPALQRTLETLAESGAFAVLGGGPPCSSFSTAVTPPVRNSRYPSGFKHLSRKWRATVRLGNRVAAWTMHITRICHPATIVWFENPRLSWLWSLRSWRSGSSLDTVGTCVVDFCRSGIPWRKRTRISTTCPLLAGSAYLCTCQQLHVPLRGRGADGRPLTAVACPYPWRVADFFAYSFCSYCGWCPAKAQADAHLAALLERALRAR